MNRNKNSRQKALLSRIKICSPLKKKKEKKKKKERKKNKKKKKRIRSSKLKM